MPFEHRALYGAEPDLYLCEERADLSRTINCCYNRTAQSLRKGEQMARVVYGGLIIIILAAIGCTVESGSAPSAPSVSLRLVSELHNDVRESSGLARVDGKIYTHNDSGGSPLLYEINATTGEVVRTVIVNGANNVDWEALACDDTYLYIGDIGNNLGSRTDLKIYKIPKIDLAQNMAVTAEEIAFSYADQATYEEKLYTTSYDAEALIAYNGQLYLFTKNWADYNCRVYRLPTLPGSYVVAPVAEKALDIMVTGAAFDAESGSVALVGYTNPGNIVSPFKSAIVMLHGFTGDDLFSGKITEYEIEKSQHVGPVEAILFNSPGQLYLTAEGVTAASVEDPARFYETAIPE